MKKIILNILTPLALMCAFLLLIFFSGSIVVSGMSQDVNFSATFASYLGEWAPSWTLPAVIFLLGVAVVLIIAEKSWWLGWSVLIIACILPLYVLIMERYILVSPVPEWEKGIILIDGLAFYIYAILQICAIAGLVVTIFLPDISETKANN